jgi:hypothetical protein
MKAGEERYITLVDHYITLINLSSKNSIWMLYDYGSEWS